MSGGQKRRVDVARALLNNPKILILDEPTTGLDPEARKALWSVVTSLRKNRNMTVFLTTHYMEETKDADHVVILDKGKIICQDTPAKLKSQYTSNRLVWYTEQSKEAENILAELGDGKLTYEADHYRVHVKSSVTEFLYKHRDKLVDYEVIKGTMDDVFLNLTGKELV